MENFPLNTPDGWQEADKSQIYIKKIMDLSGYHIWEVYGDYVMITFDMDFVVAGNDRAKEYIPEKEIWIDRSVPENDRMFVIIHEISENIIMREYGIPYDNAHNIANYIEYGIRKKNYVPLQDAVAI